MPRVLRQTKKLRELVQLLRGRSGTTALRQLAAERPGLIHLIKATDSHDEAYWIAAQAGLAYDSDAGWYVVDMPGAAPGAPFDLRLEGPHGVLVAAEIVLRNAGIHVSKRSGPQVARGGVSLSYLSCRLPKHGGGR